MTDTWTPCATCTGAGRGFCEQDKTCWGDDTPASWLKKMSDKEIRRARKAVVRALVDYEAAKRFNSPTLRYTTAEALTAACDEYNTLTNKTQVQDYAGSPLRDTLR